MTIVIKKTDSKDTIRKKLERLQKHSVIKKERIFKELCGSLKGVFKEDAVKLQRKWRNEWQ